MIIELVRMRSIRINEVRNPCYRLNEMHARLLKTHAYKVDGQVNRYAGMMARVLKGGWGRPAMAWLFLDCRANSYLHQPNM